MTPVSAFLLVLGFASFASSYSVWQASYTYSDSNCETLIGLNIDLVTSDACTAAVIGCTAFGGSYYKVDCWGTTVSPFPDPVPDNWIVYTNWGADQASQTCTGQVPFNYYAPANSCTKASGFPFKLTSECLTDSPINIAFYPSDDCSGSPSVSYSISAPNMCVLTDTPADAYGFCQLPPPVAAAPVAPPMDAPVAEPMAAPSSGTPTSTPVASTPVAPIAGPKSSPVATPVKKSSGAASSSIGAGLVIAVTCFCAL